MLVFPQAWMLLWNKEDPQGRCNSAEMGCFVLGSSDNHGRAVQQGIHRYRTESEAYLGCSIEMDQMGERGRVRKSHRLLLNSTASREGWDC
jgi:hypothetical protein